MYIFAVDLNNLSTSDWVLILCNLFLGIVALVAPYVSECIKRWRFSPKLKIEFNEAPPGCHKTRLTGQNINEPCYYFRLIVTNIGKSTARNCEAILENLEQANAAGGYSTKTKTRFTPVKLNWGSLQGEYININPSRRCFCDLLHVPSENYQKQFPGPNVNPRSCSAFPIGILLDVKFHMNSQPSRLPIGKYRVEIAIYSENATKVNRTFEIAWSGNWKDQEEDMFKELVIV
jgi:hypothetical protein